MTEHEKLLYIAGFFDGEGCIMIKKTGRSFTLQITVTNTDKAPLQLICDTFGGIIYDIKPTNIRAKMCYMWYIGGSNAGKVLEELLPFLIVRKKHALVAIRYNISNNREYKAQLATQMSILNRKGRQQDKKKAPEH